MFSNYQIILGSNSPRRQELMEGLGIPFTVDTGNTFEESVPPGTPFEEVPVLMAEGKSAGFHRALRPGEILITADTMVILPPSGDKPGEILGKPRDREDAARMLRVLSPVPTPAVVENPWGSPMNKGGRFHERHYLSRRLRHKTLPADNGHIQAAFAGV